MRYMGKGKIRLYFGAMAIGAIAYILYMFIDFIDVKYNIPPSVTAVEQIIEERGVMASWHPEGIDALVIGGSNAMYGLSAEILSDQLGISFLNLTLLSEGHNEKIIIISFKIRYLKWKGIMSKRLFTLLLFFTRQLIP